MFTVCAEHRRTVKITKKSYFCIKEHLSELIKKDQNFFVMDSGTKWHSSYRLFGVKISHERHFNKTNIRKEYLVVKLISHEDFIRDDFAQMLHMAVSNDWATVKNGVFRFNKDVVSCMFEDDSFNFEESILWNAVNYISPEQNRLASTQTPKIIPPKK